MSGSKINPRIASITPSVTLGITNKAKQMLSEGRSIFSFSAGEPDFDTPEHIKIAAQKALEEGQTKYSPVAGLPKLRSAIAEKLKNDNGLSYAHGQIVVSNGAKHSLFNVITALCNDGDEFIIPAPYWLSYPEMVGIGGGKSVFVNGAESNSYKITAEDFESAITDRTRAIIINSPSNPVGAVYSEDELKSIADVALRHGVYIISDEIYENVLYDGFHHFSIGSISDEVIKQTITINGFSKVYSMTGWRLGYMAGPADIVQSVIALQSHSTSSPNTFAQYGALEALTGSQDCLVEMLSAFSRRREYLYGRLSKIEGVKCVKPMGAFYMLPDISSFGLDSVTFADRLLSDFGVAVIPGAPFGVDSNIRISYACDIDNIKGGMDQFEAFVASL